MSNAAEQDLFARNLRLKGHIYFNKVADGVYFQGQSGGFILKGDGIYPLVAKIISFIDAGFSLLDIQSKLPEKLRPFFTNLITQLAQHQMLMPRDAEQLVPESWMAFTHFRDLFRYLSESSADFINLFPQWQEQKIALVGDGYVLKSALEGVATSGIQTLTVVMTKETISRQEIKDALDYYSAKLPGFSAELILASEGATTDVSGFDQILYCSTQLQAGHSYYHHAEQACLVAGLLYGQAVVSPLSSVSGTGFNDMAEQLTRVSADSDLSFPQAGLSMLGSIAALNVIKGFFDIDVSGLSNYVYRVSSHLEMSRHPLLPVEVSSGISADEVRQFQAEYEMPDDRELEQYEQVRLALTAYFDPLLGCLDESVGKEVKQVPLFHSKLRLSFPSSMDCAAKEVMSCGLNAATAGLRAIAQALSLRTATQLGVPVSRITTDFDQQSWEKNAYARLVSEQPEFVQKALSARINLMQLDDEEMQLLLHFLQSVGYRHDALILYWDEACYCFVASIQLLNSDTAYSTVAATAEQAIRDCLCGVYLQAQFDEANVIESAIDLALPEVQFTDQTGEVLRELLHHSAAKLPKLERVQGDVMLATHGIYSGYALLAEESSVEESCVDKIGGV
ncbi:hypothetical protein KIH87_06795 [Paraneptunicella aestuarii]|uniref:hypothetical protein n=1 Tax=Paraneptunicella aestuarii TaxID=2831148 RepID=UPI001E2B9FE9|nr:hypothetical protein [Paraneptunicella aestuarii]UAA40052.1 hypothetical protein KIH87_06795 [Paraneptunicella aestuarii]